MARCIRSQVCSDKKRLLNVVCIGLALLAALSACKSERSETHTPRTPQRIISLVPSVTEILFAIGAGDRVAGISDFDTYPPEALDLPRVGALINPNMETILSLKPDLVITYGTQSLLHEQLASVGIQQFSFVAGPTDHILSFVRTLGLKLDLEENGNLLAEEIENVLEKLRRTRPVDPPKVLLVHSRDLGTMGSFYSAGSDSYFNELIDIAGGRNLFDDVPEDAFQPSLEAVLNRGPEVIIELLASNQGGDQRLELRRQDWDALTSIPAVHNGRVYVLAEDYLLLVGPRLHQVAQDLANVIRSDIFEDQ